MTTFNKKKAYLTIKKCKLWRHLIILILQDIYGMYVKFEHLHIKFMGMANH